MRLCVFPNDSLKSYYEKGEIKERYFNPKNWFDEVHVVSLFDEEIDDSKVEKLAGKGKLIIHKLGKADLSNFKSFEKKVFTLINDIKPDILRAYNPLVQGWLATRAAKKLKIPIIVSLHTNYDQQREFAKKKGRYFQYLKLSYASKKWEKVSLQNADAVICVYEFIVPYAKKMGGKNIHLIYNRVDLKNFSSQLKPALNLDKPSIISVGRLNDQKDQRILIKAMKELDAYLILIGDGPNYPKIEKLVRSLNIENKVRIFKKISNEKLGEYYVSCDIYAQPMVNLEGIPIPVLEAMACGLPVVMSRHSKDYSEIIDDATYFVNNTEQGFRQAFEEILLDDVLKNNLKTQSLNVIKKISGGKMEDAELEVYKKLMQ